jgi:citrate synthase
MATKAYYYTEVTPLKNLPQSDFMEVAFLLLHGELPTATQKSDFEQQIKSHTKVPHEIEKLFATFPQNMHPMAMLLSAVGMLSGLYLDTAIKIRDPDARNLSAYQLIAQIPLLAAMSYRRSQQQPFLTARKDLNYAENFLHALFSKSEDAKVNPVLANALDKIFILHADHEQNASTSAVRVAGSTGANPFACMSAGIGTLWGAAHGGANEACLKMLQEIGDESKINEYIKRAKDKNDPFRLMGFGHRVYKNRDPRAEVMRAICHEVLNEQGVHDSPIFKLAMKLEKIAAEDSYFIEKKLYPNVDFYSGITLNALGLPTNMFTVIFALSRTVGWLTQWMEIFNESAARLVRPRQLYTGYKQRKYKPVDGR